MHPQAHNLIRAKPRTGQKAGVEVRAGPVSRSKKGFLLERK